MFLKFIVTTLQKHLVNVEKLNGCRCVLKHRFFWGQLLFNGITIIGHMTAIFNVTNLFKNKEKT